MLHHYLFGFFSTHWPKVLRKHAHFYWLIPPRGLTSIVNIYTFIWIRTFGSYSCANHKVQRLLTHTFEFVIGWSHSVLWSMTHRRIYTQVHMLYPRSYSYRDARANQFQQSSWSISFNEQFSTLSHHLAWMTWAISCCTFDDFQLLVFINYITLFLQWTSIDCAPTRRLGHEAAVTESKESSIGFNEARNMEIN